MSSTAASQGSALRDRPRVSAIGMSLPREPVPRRSRAPHVGSLLDHAQRVLQRLDLGLPSACAICSPAVGNGGASALSQSWQVGGSDADPDGGRGAIHRDHGTQRQGIHYTNHGMGAVGGIVVEKRPGRIFCPASWR